MKTVALSRTYTVGSSIFSELTFREPKLGDYRRRGPVTEKQRGLLVRYPEAVWGYAEDLVQDINPGALDELDLVDALEVEDAITDFFSKAQQARVPPAN